MRSLKSKGAFKAPFSQKSKTGTVQSCSVSKICPRELSPLHLGGRLQTVTPKTRKQLIKRLAHSMTKQTVLVSPVSSPGITFPFDSQPDPTGVTGLSQDVNVKEDNDITATQTESVLSTDSQPNNVIVKEVGDIAATQTKSVHSGEGFDMKLSPVNSKPDPTGLPNDVNVDQGGDIAAMLTKSVSDSQPNDVNVKQFEAIPATESVKSAPFGEEFDLEFSDDEPENKLDEKNSEMAYKTSETVVVNQDVSNETISHEKDNTEKIAAWDESVSNVCDLKTLPKKKVEEMDVINVNQSEENKRIDRNKTITDQCENRLNTIVTKLPTVPAFHKRKSVKSNLKCKKSKVETKEEENTMKSKHVIQTNRTVHDKIISKKKNQNCVLAADEKIISKKKKKGQYSVLAADEKIISKKKGQNSVLAYISTFKSFIENKQQKKEKIQSKRKKVKLDSTKGNCSTSKQYRNKMQLKQDVLRMIRKTHLEIEKLVKKRSNISKKGSTTMEIDELGSSLVAEE